MYMCVCVEARGGFQFFPHVFLRQEVSLINLILVNSAMLTVPQLSLFIFTWVLGLELRPLCLCDKCFTN